MTRETPHPIDEHVGRRVRLRRKQRGLSQGSLAEALGLTFQQIQKYERGSNRISASKLYGIATVLGVPVGFFYEGLNDPSSPEGEAYTDAWSQVFEDLLAEPNGRTLAEAFLSIRRESVRRALAEFVRVVAANDQDGLSSKAAAE
ncbi:MAG: helix-turn-helix transcriptional regulator [Pseudomonadota bacterium]